MYNTKTPLLSFPLVSVRKIPGKYQPIPNRNTESGYNSKNIVDNRVVYRIGIFWLVLVSISWYLPHRYRRKSWSVHLGIIFLAGTPFSLKKGALAPFLREKGGTGPLFDSARPSLAEKRSSRQSSNTNRNTDSPINQIPAKYR